MSRVALLAIALTAVAACTRPPRNLAGEFPPITVSDAQRARADGTTVRWGGALVETRPGKDQTCFEVVSLPLDRQARPRPTDDTAGRFVACAPGFYDPSVYAKGREVTVVGTLHGETSRTVGEFEYQYPVVEAKTVHLWEQPRPGYGGGPGIGISIGGVFGGW